VSRIIVSFSKYSASLYAGVSELRKKLAEKGLNVDHVRRRLNLSEIIHD
jgi:hypothetical protein